MWFFYVTGILLLLSFFADKKKTKKALFIAYKRFIIISPSFLIMLIFVSVILYLLPQEKIIMYLDSDYHLVNVILAALIGSVSVMPGFVVFPLAGILKSSGISYMIIASFTTTLMMVGIVTYPVEKDFFGIKITVIRNIISLIMAIIVSIIIGLFYGELFI